MYELPHKHDDAPLHVRKNNLAHNLAIALEVETGEEVARLRRMSIYQLRAASHDLHASYETRRKKRIAKQQVRESLGL